MSPFLGEKKNSMLDISEATAMMLISHYNIQDMDIVNTAFMAMVDPENYTTNLITLEIGLFEYASFLKIK